MAQRDTKYATEIASAADDLDQRIERLYVKGWKQDEIRFSWWRNGKMMPRPLDLPEKELLPLMSSAIRSGVFTDDFLRGLQTALMAHFQGRN
jgi:hypothetical protein